MPLLYKCHGHYYLSLSFDYGENTKDTTGQWGTFFLFIYLFMQMYKTESMKISINCMLNKTINLVF